MKRRGIPLLLILICLVLSCPGGASETASPSGSLRRGSINAGSMERSYIVYTPSGQLSSPPLFIVLHGSLGTGERMHELCGDQFDRLAQSRRCIVVYPDGFKKHWNDCRTAPTDAAHAQNIDDVGFIKALIAECRLRWRIDPAKVYAVGFSNGGHMCFRLASEMPSQIAGIAAIGASMPSPKLSRCAGPKPLIPVVIINGTKDPINPFEGGMVRLLYFFKKGEVLSTLDSARIWLSPENRMREPDGKQLEDRDPEDKTRIEKLTWPGEKVGLFIVHGGGHTVPGGKQYLPKLIVGKTSLDMNAAEEIWNFFQEHAASR